MHLKSSILVATLFLGLVGAARADEVSEKGREVFNKHHRAVVTVQLVQKVNYATAGRSGESAEFKQDITGAVVDPSGLTVLALSMVDPAETGRRMYGDRYKAEIEISDVKILLEDGAEIDAEIVLRDKDLDLAFIRPKTKLATPMPAIDLTKSAPAQVLETVIAINRLGRAASRAYSASIERISAVVQRPRTFYIPDSTMTATTSGSPAFALDGRIVGLFVLRTLSSSGASAARSDNSTYIILPAEDVLKAAKQAPEARGGASTPEASKAAPEKN